jgi:hypothetical protein
VETRESYRCVPGIGDDCVIDSLYNGCIRRPTKGQLREQDFNGDLTMPYNDR